jgi:hypothetical protein
MDTASAIFILALLGLLFVRTLWPVQPPAIIYVQEAPPSTDLGCLPLILVGGLILVVLYLSM